MPPEGASLLKAAGVDAGYGTMQVLWGVDLDVRSGETVLLLDELAAGLNSAELDWIAGRIKALAATGMAVIVVEHLMGFIEHITDRVIVLNAGKEIFEGKLAAAVKEPQVIEVFLGGEHAA